MLAIIQLSVASLQCAVTRSAAALTSQPADTGLDFSRRDVPHAPAANAVNRVRSKLLPVADEAGGRFSSSAAAGTRRRAASVGRSATQRSAASSARSGDAHGIVSRLGAPRTFELSDTPAAAADIAKEIVTVVVPALLLHVNRDRTRRGVVQLVSHLLSSSPDLADDTLDQLARVILAATADVAGNVPAAAQAHAPRGEFATRTAVATGCLLLIADAPTVLFRASTQRQQQLFTAAAYFLQHHAGAGGAVFALREPPTGGVTSAAAALPSIGRGSARGRLIGSGGGTGRHRVVTSDRHSCAGAAVAALARLRSFMPAEHWIAALSAVTPAAQAAVASCGHEISLRDASVTPPRNTHPSLLASPYHIGSSGEGTGGAAGHLFGQSAHRSATPTALSSANRSHAGSSNSGSDVGRLLSARLPNGASPMQAVCAIQFEAAAADSEAPAEALVRSSDERHGPAMSAVQASTVESRAPPSSAIDRVGQLRTEIAAILSPQSKAARDIALLQRRDAKGTESPHASTDALNAVGTPVVMPDGASPDSHKFTISPIGENSTTAPSSLLQNGTPDVIGSSGAEGAVVGSTGGPKVAVKVTPDAASTSSTLTIAVDVDAADHQNGARGTVDECVDAPPHVITSGDAVEATPFTEYSPCEYSPSASHMLASKQRSSVIGSATVEPLLVDGRGGHQRVTTPIAVITPTRRRPTTASTAANKRDNTSPILGDLLLRRIQSAIAELNPLLNPSLASPSSKRNIAQVISASTMIDAMPRQHALPQPNKLELNGGGGISNDALHSSVTLVRTSVMPTPMQSPAVSPLPKMRTSSTEVPLTSISKFDAAAPHRVLTATSDNDDENELSAVTAQSRQLCRGDGDEDRTNSTVVNKLLRQATDEVVCLGGAERNELCGEVAAVISEDGNTSGRSPLPASIQDASVSSATSTLIDGSHRLRGSAFGTTALSDSAEALLGSRSEGAGLSAFRVGMTTFSAGSTSSAGGISTASPDDGVAATRLTGLSSLWAPPVGADTHPTALLDVPISAAAGGDSALPTSSIACQTGSSVTDASATTISIGEPRDDTRFNRATSKPAVDITTFAASSVVSLPAPPSSRRRMGRGASRSAPTSPTATGAAATKLFSPSIAALLVAATPQPGDDAYFPITAKTVATPALSQAPDVVTSKLSGNADAHREPRSFLEGATAISLRVTPSQTGATNANGVSQSDTPAQSVQPPSRLDDVVRETGARSLAHRMGSVITLNSREPAMYSSPMTLGDQLMTSEPRLRHESMGRSPSAQDRLPPERDHSARSKASPPPSPLRSKSQVVSTAPRASVAEVVPSGTRALRMAQALGSEAGGSAETVASPSIRQRTAASLSASELPRHLKSTTLPELSPSTAALPMISPPQGSLGLLKARSASRGRLVSSEDARPPGRVTDAVPPLLPQLSSSATQLMQGSRGGRLADVDGGDDKRASNGGYDLHSQLPRSTDHSSSGAVHSAIDTHLTTSSQASFMTTHESVPAHELFASTAQMFVAGTATVPAPLKLPTFNFPSLSVPGTPTASALARSPHGRTSTTPGAAQQRSHATTVARGRTDDRVDSALHVTAGATGGGVSAISSAVAAATARIAGRRRSGASTNSGGAMTLPQQPSYSRSAATRRSSHLMTSTVNTSGDRVGLGLRTVHVDGIAGGDGREMAMSPQSSNRYGRRASTRSHSSAPRVRNSSTRQGVAAADFVHHPDTLHSQSNFGGRTGGVTATHDNISEAPLLPLRQPGSSDIGSSTATSHAASQPTGNVPSDADNDSANPIVSPLRGSDGAATSASSSPSRRRHTAAATTLTSLTRRAVLDSAAGVSTSPYSNAVMTPSRPSRAVIGGSAKGLPSAASAGSSAVYTASSALLPLDAPVPALRAALTDLLLAGAATLRPGGGIGLGSPATAGAAAPVIFSQAAAGADAVAWDRHFAALDTVRRAALHHPRLLLDTSLAAGAAAAATSSAGIGATPFPDTPTAVLASTLTTSVDSLRSAVAKNACFAVADVWTALGSELDACLVATDSAALLPTLLRRAGDTNAFLSDAANAALEAVLAGGGDVRLLSSLLSACSAAAPMGICNKAAPLLARLVASIPPSRLPTSGHRDAPRLVAAAGRFIEAGNVEVRRAGHALLASLMSAGVVDTRALELSLPERVWRRAAELLAKGAPTQLPRRGRNVVSAERLQHATSPDEARHPVNPTDTATNEGRQDLGASQM